jgi:SEC-C motif-containing protein
MRSRYAAYALGLADYIIDTTDPEGPAWEGEAAGADAGPPRAAWRGGILRFARGTRFVGLTIVATTASGPGSGTVHFRADLVQAGRAVVLEEVSRFVHRGGNWRYSAGQQVR